jgi:hypothetical protein
MDNVFLLDRSEIVLTEREMLMLATVEPLLRKARLSLYCEKCYAQGLSDGGIRGNNGMNDKAWTIECNCSVRKASNPAKNAVTVG